jgi:SAM-dependent methyltransferase
VTTPLGSSPAIITETLVQSTVNCDKEKVLKISNVALNSEAVIRHSKSLDIRSHKQEWLNIDYLRSRQADEKALSKFILSNERRIDVVSCYVCRGSDRKEFARSYGIPYFQCADCGHVYASVVLPPEELATYYRKEYFEDTVYVDDRQVDRRKYMVYEPKVRFVMDFVQNHRKQWLDVGTGNGSLLACARDLGFDGLGLEPGTLAIEFAERTFGLTLLPHPIQEELQRSGPASYDVVSFFMVLEHVSNPREQVSTAAELLAPGGLLVIEVPTAESMSARLDSLFTDQGLRQLVNEHIMLYTVQSAKRLVEDSGCQPEGFWFMGQDIFNLFIHLALHNPQFLHSPMAEFLLANNDALQQIVDRNEFCDEVIIVARKPS